jgi:hypothetical protein
VTAGGYRFLLVKAGGLTEVNGSSWVRAGEVAKEIVGTTATISIPVVALVQFRMLRA